MWRSDGTQSIPFVNEDMEQVLEAAWDAGARTAFYTVIRLPWEVAPIFREWVELHYPQRASRIMARIHEMRGGKDYEPVERLARIGQYVPRPVMSSGARR